MTYGNKLKILKKKKSGNLRSPKYAVVFQILLGRPLYFTNKYLTYNLGKLCNKFLVLFYFNKSVSFKRSTLLSAKKNRGRNKNSVFIVNVKNINKQI